MIIEENINCWEEFEPKLDEIKSKYSKTSDGFILYRGQSDSCWHLQTTLEQFCKKVMTLEDYLDITIRCVNPIESFTINIVNLSKDNIINEINRDPNSVKLPIQCYKYWIYLRHHGFPSPFLDWTSCPYIAAFFAFEEINKAERCSIYVYIERPKSVKVRNMPGSQILSLGHYLKADVRHSLQHSWYTMALRANHGSPDLVMHHKIKIISHEDIFKHSDEEQDLLIKITIPRKERNQVLKYLDEKKINHFNLFQSEKSFLQTLAFKEFQLHNL